MWYREIAWMAPVEAAERLSGLPGLNVLDSAMEHETLGRFSTVAADPFGTFHVEEGVAFWNGSALAEPPLAAFRAELARYAIEPVTHLPPFQGGAVGYFAYEFGHVLDHGPHGFRAPQGQTASFGFYDTIVAFDHLSRRAWIIASGWPAPSAPARRRRAAARIAAFAARLDRMPLVPRRSPGPLTWQADVSAQAYRDAVEAVKAYIRAGDIYQANIAQRFSSRLPSQTDGLSLYKQLRAANPAPFAAYLACGETIILSSSPERFVRKTGRHVETRPIKGTARRGGDAREDAALAEALVASSKDRAENIMIVDLLRNDFARVCEPASVDVPQLCGLETYASVHHLVSVVTGVLREGADALDLIGATFPGGSITGAPKLRAMEIIAEIEARPRGPYCGAIGAIGFDGDADFNIVIRSVVIENGRATLQVGGGVTILSDAEVEYQETLTKARRIFEAFSGAGALASDALV